MRENLKSRYDFLVEDEENYSVQTGISETVPDQSVDLKTLVARQARGQEIRQFKPEWTGATDFDEAFPDWEKMDKIERLIALKQVEDNIKQIQWKLDDAAKIRVAEEREKLINDEVTRRTTATTETTATT